jgi:hypothetical protein
MRFFYCWVADNRYWFKCYISILEDTENVKIREYTNLNILQLEQNANFRVNIDGKEITCTLNGNCIIEDMKTQTYINRSYYMGSIYNNYREYHNNLLILEKNYNIKSQLHGEYIIYYNNYNICPFIVDKLVMYYVNGHMTGLIYGLKNIPEKYDEKKCKVIFETFNYSEKKKYDFEQYNPHTDEIKCKGKLINGKFVGQLTFFGLNGKITRLVYDRNHCLIRPSDNIPNIIDEKKLNFNLIDD